MKCFFGRDLFCGFFLCGFHENRVWFFFLLSVG